MNTERISRVLARRLAEVRERVSRLDPQAFGEMGFFVTAVKEASLDQPDRSARLTAFSPPEYWCAADTDCLTSLRVLSSHGAKTMRPGPRPPVDQFIEQLKQKATAREPTWELLLNRYAWPLNFSFHADEDVREYVLMRLMTNERARFEQRLTLPAETEDVLLKLNLISIHAATTSDLRFLDALNYYYELLAPDWHPESQHAWLLVSWYALYARALNSWP